MKNVAKTVLLVAAVSVFSAPLARADWFTDFVERQAFAALIKMAKDQSLIHLQNRSVTAIEKATPVRDISLVRDDFDKILPYAALAANYSWTVYNKRTECRALEDDGQPVSGPGGAYVTVYQKTFKPGRKLLLPAEFPRPRGWGEDETKSYKAVFVSFRGTDIFSGKDWLTNLYAAIGGQPAQYAWAIDMAATVLNQFPDDRLVIFTGHSLGGAMATYAALAFRTGAITFNSAGLHPYNFKGAVFFDPNPWHSEAFLYDPTVPQGDGYVYDVPTSLYSLSPVDVTNIYHFLSHSNDGKTDIVGNVSFAGYSMLPGAKFFINIDNIDLGAKPSLLKYISLHSAWELCSHIDNIDKSGKGDAQMSDKQLYGRPIYSQF